MKNSRRYDSESGLYYYRLRTYNPRLGRFLQQDPLGFIDSLNQYAYVLNNPVNFIDPLGLSRMEGGSNASAGNPFISKYRPGEVTQNNRGEQIYWTKYGQNVPVTLPEGEFSEIVEHASWTGYSEIEVYYADGQGGRKIYRLDSTPPHVEMLTGFMGLSVAATGIGGYGFGAVGLAKAMINKYWPYVFTTTVSWMASPQGQTTINFIEGTYKPELPFKLPEAIGASISYGWMINEEYKFIPTEGE